MHIYIYIYIKIFFVYIKKFSAVVPYMALQICILKLIEEEGAVV